MVVTESRLREILAHFSTLHVLVLGDFFLDKYLELDRRLAEVSLETGLEAHQVTAVRVSPGAAGTVVSNLHALGAQVAVLGVIGDTGEGYELRRGLSVLGVDDTQLIVRGGLLTPTYMKPMMHERDGRVHELERLDIKNRRALPGDVEEEVVRRLEVAAPAADAVVISEYVQDANHGVVTERVRAALAGLAAQSPQQIYIADSRTRIALYRRVAIKINQAEALQAFGQAEGASRERLAAAGQDLAARNGRPVFITLGPEGLLACDEGGSTHVRTVPSEGPIDTVGAGDSTLAGIVLALAAGARIAEAGLVGNLVAAVTIRQIGTTGTASPKQVLEQYARWLAMQELS